MKWYKVGEQELPPDGTMLIPIRSIPTGQEYLAPVICAVINGKIERDDEKHGRVTQYAIIELPELKR